MTFEKKQIQVFFAVTLGIVTAVGIAAVFASPTFADRQLQATLASNCRTASFPADVDKNVLYDPESGIVRVDIHVAGRERSVTLPYRPDISFSGCSADAQELLGRIKENEESYIAEMCTEMTEIVAGTIPLSERDGKKANMAGAEQFVKKFCDK